VADSRLVNLADNWGKAIGTFQKSRRTAAGIKRPSFFESWTDEGKGRAGASSYYGVQQQAQQRAMHNAWVFTAISFIAREISAAKFQVVEYHGPDEEPTDIPNHAFEELLRMPNPWMGGGFLWQYSTWWLQLNGNFYWFLGNDEDGQLAEIWPLPSEDMEVWPGDAERFIDFYRYTVGGHQYDIPAEYIVHVRLPNPRDIFRGLAPLSAAMLAVDTDQAMARWNAKFFGKDNTMPSAVIAVSSGNDEMPLAPADIDALKRDLRSDYQAHQRRVAIIEAMELQVELLGWNPKDLDFIQGREFTKQEIYAILGIPSGMLDPNATFSNSENAEMVFTNKTLWPLLTLIGEQLTAEVIWPIYGDKYAARFDDVRTTNRERELTEVSASGAYLTIDEVRKRYWHLDPLPGGRGRWTANEAQSMDPSQVIEGTYSIKPGDNGSTPALPEATRPALLPSGETEESDRKFISDDLRRWRRKTVNRIRDGRPLPVEFDSVVIPDWLSLELGAKLSTLDVLRDYANLTDAQILEQAKAFFQEVELSPYPFSKERHGVRGTG